MYRSGRFDGLVLFRISGSDASDTWLSVSLTGSSSVSPSSAPESWDSLFAAAASSSSLRNSCSISSDCRASGLLGGALGVCVWGSLLAAADLNLKTLAVLTLFVLLHPVRSRVTVLFAWTWLTFHGPEYLGCSFRHRSACVWNSFSITLSPTLNLASGCFSFHRFFHSSCARVSVSAALVLAIGAIAKCSHSYSS